MKRESGENPEQTRCCKLHQSLWAIPNPLFRKEWEGCPKDGVSQKTCQSHFVVSFRGIELKT